MADKYKVKQGDHTSSIAFDAGLGDYKIVWLDGPNASLRQTRKNPNILLPGDEVTVRARAQKTQSVATDARHRFKRSGGKLDLRIRLLTEPGKPAKKVECWLTVEGTDHALTTDGSGVVEMRIPPNAHSGRLVINDAKNLLSIDQELGIGELNPIDKTSGQIARLNNLGYFAGPAEEPADDDAKLKFRSAVEEFQCDYGLKVDGVCGPNTQKELEHAHGC